jgi:hypothetical protein
MSLESQTGNRDIAEANLICAVGLPGAGQLDIPSCLATLDRWAEAIRRYTADCRQSRTSGPGDRGEEGFFHFLQMVTLLKHPRGLNIRYQPRAIGSFDFSDSRDDFLHGLLTRRLGTCASLPVLFVALGRRLGYPMHLAIAKQHFFCQWVNEDGTHINLEGSGPGGGEMYPDEHYLRWPRPLTAADLASGRYLRPLTPAEELAAFLETRGHCLVDNKRFAEARKVYIEANRIAPQWSILESHLRPLDMFEARFGHSLNVVSGRTASQVARDSGSMTFRQESNPPSS